MLPARDNFVGYQSFETPRFYLSSTSEPETEEYDSKRLLQRDNTDCTASQDK
jgi:hypothetical protein